MKKYLAILLLALTTTVSFGASKTVSLTGAASVNLLSVPGVITYMTVTGTSNTVNLQFYDASGTNIYYTNDAFTYRYWVSASVTNIYTDILGNSETNVYNAYTNTLATNSAATTAYPLVFTLSNVTSNNTATYTPVTPISFWRGLALTNASSGNSTGGASVTITYIPGKQ